MDTSSILTRSLVECGLSSFVQSSCCSVLLPPSLLLSANLGPAWLHLSAAQVWVFLGATATTADVRAVGCIPRCPRVVRGQGLTSTILQGQSVSAPPPHLTSQPMSSACLAYKGASLRCARAASVCELQAGY